MLIQIGLAVGMVGNFAVRADSSDLPSILLWGAVLVSAICLGLFTSYWVAYLIMRLSQTSQQIANGKLAHLETENPVRELNFLEHSFNQIAQQLKEAQQVQPVRQETEELLSEKQYYNYYSIVENSLEGIFQSTPEGRYQMVNPALAHIYGYDSPQDLIAHVTDIGKQIYVQPKRRVEFMAYMQLYSVVSDFESQVYRKDGSIIWISENVRAVRNETGHLLYFEGSVQDITERRQVQEELRQQRLRAERLLLNILPQTIAERLKRGQLAIASRFDQVTVMFADLVDFTEVASRISATDVVKLLGLVFAEFDRLVEQYHLEKIKTIGDAYMVASGLPTARADHADAIAEMALAMQQSIAHILSDAGEPFQLRIGINSGPIVAGVIGTKKFSYDLWGDTVNVASRMESQGLPGKIQVTAATYELLSDRYRFEEREPIFVKGKGEMITYWLIGKQNGKSSLPY
ncbi:MAG: adenylate/guanylate cyclase domain-containing protein [Kovacikia sp.]